MRSGFDNSSVLVIPSSRSNVTFPRNLNLPNRQRGKSVISSAEAHRTARKECAFALIIKAKWFRVLQTEYMSRTKFEVTDLPVGRECLKDRINIEGDTCG